MEDDIDELPDSDFSKAFARVFNKIDHGNSVVFSWSIFVDLIEIIGFFFMARS